MMRSTDLAVLPWVAEGRQGLFTGTPNLSMNGDKGRSQIGGFHIVPNSDSRSK
jgi:hypothetical protein